MDKVASTETASSHVEKKQFNTDGVREPVVASEQLLQQVLVTSAYRKKLVQEVQRKLQKALDLPSQRGDILHLLFTDIALEVDSRAKARLYNEENLESPRFRDREHPLCFYEVLAEHYARAPGEGNAAVSLFVQLWSQPLAAQIFTLLFYKWLFEVLGEDSEAHLRYSTAFVEGGSALFWIDMESNIQRFFPLYNYTLDEVIMNPQRHSRFSNQARCKLVLMLSRFFFFYESSARLEDFFRHFPPFPSNLGPADVFVVELADQVQKVKIEPALLQYLKKSEVLKGLRLQVSTSTRLRTTLYGLTSPGGPLYPTRPVRHAARDILDCLFPVGRNSRHLISLAFRLMYPYYWPTSVWNFMVTSIVGTGQRISLQVHRIWDFVVRRPHYPHE